MGYLPFLLVIPIILSLLLRLNSHLQTWTYFQQAKQRKQSTWQPTVSIIVPVKGLDQKASVNFQSLCQQDYPQPYEIIFALETDDDPAVPVIQELIQRHPQRAIKLIFSEPLGLTAVGKIKNLIAGYRDSQHEAIVLIDSDVYVEPDFLSQSVGFVAPDEAGAAYAVPVCEGSEDWVAALHNMAVNSAVLNYGSAAYQKRLNSLVGSIIIVRRDVLDTIGGLDAIAHRVVGIDVSLGQAIHQAGYSIQLLVQPARIYHIRDNFSGYWWQFHRWAVTIRYYVPIFPLLIIFLALPLWWALIFLCLAILQQTYIGIGLILVGIVLAADVFSIAVINQRLVNDQKFWPFLWVALLGEVSGLPILVHSLFSTKVLWRGRWLSIAE
ncbi:MAG: glycosyltransferase [Cyanobacteria bacterium P01_F01_bin.150]